MASAPPPQAAKSPRPRFRFGLATLLLFFLVFSFVLSRYYPRVCYSVTVRTGAANPRDALMYSYLARSTTALQGAMSRCPDIASHAEGDALTWLQTHVRVQPTDDILVRVMIVGRPKDKKHYTRVVEAVAEELVAFLQQERITRNNRSEALRDALSELAAPSQGMELPLDPGTMRIEQILAKMEDRLAQLEGELQDSKQVDLGIVKRESTWQP